MRNLQTHDVFIAMRLVNTAGIRDEFQKMALQARNGKLKPEQVGIDFIFNLIGACGNENVEALFYEFIGGILEIDPKEIKTMDPLKLVTEIEKLKEIISVEEWKAFFQSLLRMIRK